MRLALGRLEQAGAMSNVPTPAIATRTKHGVRPFESWYTTENVKVVAVVPLPGETVPLQTWVLPAPEHTAALTMGGSSQASPARTRAMAMNARKSDPFTIGPSVPPRVRNVAGPSVRVRWADWGGVNGSGGDRSGRRAADLRPN